MNIIDRREFLKTSALAAASTLLSPGNAAYASGKLRRITIQSKAPQGFKTKLAELELFRGLTSLNRATEILLTGEPQSVEGAAHLVLTIDAPAFQGQEEYKIEADERGAILSAASEQSLLYAVFEFLERQGMVFGIDGETVPIDRPASLNLPAPNQPWIAAPRFAVRGLLPWPDFLNCINIYNDEDFAAYFANMLRMRFNMFGMHVYTQNDPLAESYLSFDFAGAGHRAALEDTTMTNWGYLPQRTSTFKMGATQFFDGETFGADATRLAGDNWDIADRTTKMLRSAFDFASKLGIRTGIGFEPYRNPTEIVRALPPEAKSHPGGLVESRVGKDLLERRLADLLERYPMVDYVWLWEDEDANWQSRQKNIPISVTPFKQAHDFLRRHAPKKRLVLAGWGGVVRHFPSLHQRLPDDIIFSALSDTLGWEPVNKEFGKLEGRERWPIPWLEDDPSMWFPQFRASRFESDMKRAKDFECQGMLGIHWRHRIVDPTATYFARAGWDDRLTATEHYEKFCAAQASGPRAKALAGLFVDCDQHRKISSTFLGGYGKDGFAKRIELTGDYSEAFTYDTTEPDLSVLPTQRQIAGELRKLTDAAEFPTEQERVGYFAGFVGMMVPYCDAFESAHQLHAVLKTAVKLRAYGRNDEARARVLHEGVPLWLAIAPLVRQTMLEYQAIIATRNDQGQLASMQNKFLRIALERLRLSLEEFLGELPPDVDHAYTASIAPDATMASRVFLPTRPSLLEAGEMLRIFIVVPSNGTVGEVHLCTRYGNKDEWTTRPAPLAGRHVYQVELGPFTQGETIVEYYVTATVQGEGRQQVAPPEAPLNVYKLTVI
jgi:hypothetical protein